MRLIVWKEACHLCISQNWCHQFIPIRWQMQVSELCIQDAMVSVQFSTLPHLSLKGLVPFTSAFFFEWKNFNVSLWLLWWPELLDHDYLYWISISESLLFTSTITGTQHWLLAGLLSHPWDFSIFSERFDGNIDWRMRCSKSSLFYAEEHFLKWFRDFFRWNLSETFDFTVLSDVLLKYLIMSQPVAN